MMEHTPSAGQAPTSNPMQPVFELLRGEAPDAVCARHGIDRTELERRMKAYQESRREVALLDVLSTKRVGRNDPCPCGSGKKFKKCCLPKHEEAKKTLPADQVQKMEQMTRAREKLELDVRKGFDLLSSREYGKALKLARHLLEQFPEDDRLHDICAGTHLGLGEYSNSVTISRKRWQVSREEKEFFQENGYHKREGLDKKNLVHFYSPSTWLEKLWIAQRAVHYTEHFPAGGNEALARLVAGLKAANDPDRFPGRQEEGFSMRREALAPVLRQIEAEGEAALPYLLPFTYNFSWASLFVPDLLLATGTDLCITLLAELSMFRLPYFSQLCLSNLEKLGVRALPAIRSALAEQPAFDELKVGMIMVLSAIKTEESFEILTGLTEHDNAYVVNWAAEALGRQGNPAALPWLEKARDRIGDLSKVAGAMKDLARRTGRL